MFASFVLASMLATSLTGCVPARWPSAQPGSLELLTGTPIGCLLLEEAQWTPEFLSAARSRQLAVLAVVDTKQGAGLARKALSLPFDGLVLEGDAPQEQVDSIRSLARDAGKPLVALLPRARIELDGTAPVVGTWQGLWPGIKVDPGGAVKAAPTGAPWIETNAGFLRFVRAAVQPGSAVWMANRPPDKLVLGPERYAQAIGDARMCGARWVLSLDSSFAASLLGADVKAREAWNRIKRFLNFYEQHNELCLLPDSSGLGLVQDVDSGARYSGGFLDMLAPRHIPAFIAPTRKLATAQLGDVRMLLNIAPASLTPEQKEVVRAAARQGATVVNGPPGWRVASVPGDQITFTGEQTQKIDDAWREINGLIGRRNFGVRVFGAPGVLSNLKATPDRAKQALHLVNYTQHPVESITIYIAGKHKKVTLLTPQGDKPMDTYDVDEGTGVDIAKFVDIGILLIE